MARHTYYVTREQKHPLYRTRMLQAGPLELDASAARLYRRLGVDLSEEAPKRAAPKISPEEKTEIQEPVATILAEHEAPKAESAKPKPAPKRKAARRKKS